MSDQRVHATGVTDAVAGRILVVEDDPTVAEVVSRYLRRDGHEVEVVTDGAAALARATESAPDLVVLDVMLPVVDGLEVCRRLRAAGPVAIVMLTARGDESDRVAGLELGADDYVAKPFSPRELAARVRSVLRRSGAPLPAPASREPLRAGKIVVDEAARTCVVAGREVVLTAREFDLLAYLMRHPGRAFRREELLRDVWGFSLGDTSTVTVHVRRLREKVEAAPSEPTHLQTVWGVGYRFVPGEPAP